jgi:hypothetical protein
MTSYQYICAWFKNSCSGIYATANTRTTSGRLKTTRLKRAKIHRTGKKCWGKFAPWCCPLKIKLKELYDKISRMKTATHVSRDHRNTTQTYKHVWARKMASSGAGWNGRAQTTLHPQPHHTQQPNGTEQCTNLWSNHTAHALLPPAAISSLQLHIHPIYTSKYTSYIAYTAYTYKLHGDHNNSTRFGATCKALDTHYLQFRPAHDHPLSNSKSSR